MSLYRSLAVLILAASLSGGAAAQRHASVDDESIYTAVEGALNDERSLAGADILVRSRDGFVTLSGCAASVQGIATAGRLASRVRGVTGIDNRLRVSNRPWCA